MIVRRLIAWIAGVCMLVGLLTASHWWAYQAGRKIGIDFVENNRVSEATMDILRASRVLQMAKRYPDSLPKDELQYWRQFLLRECRDMEEINIPYLQRRGETERIKACEDQVRNARALLAEIPKS